MHSDVFRSFERAGYRLGHPNSGVQKTVKFFLLDVFEQKIC